MKRFFVGTCALAVICMVSSLAHSQEWTRFHGPNGQGVSTLKSFPAQWTDKDINWKAELPGIGHSSPVVWGDQVYLFSADSKTAERYVLGIHAKDGRIVWNRTFKSEVHHLHQRSSFASCTPAVDEERVYVAWSTPTVTTFKAFTHAGDEVWSVDLGRWESQHGFGTSPMIYKDLVILSNSQQANKLKEGQKPGESFMMAFDRRTGELRWKVARVSVNVCYSVPCIYTPKGGEAELICTSTGNGMFSLNPETGEQNWAVGDAFSMRTVSSPLIVGGLLYGSTGSGAGGNYLVGIRPGKNAEVAFKIDRQAPYVPTSVASGNLMFLWYDKGIVTCIDARNGNVHWRERLDTAFSGSPIRVGDKMFCVDETGVVWVLAAEKQYKLLGKYPLGEESRSTPAVSGGQMFLRTYSHLIAVGAKSL
ncbi:MAG: PQQ-binding-like beta-propeller repeat protein [Planctomycetota bacterium]|nr:PQQ-binding-like beta-propeller repeat protein [Planctomycetota bacterium]